MAILPSERLGTDRQGYEQAMERFQTAFSHAEVERSIQAYGRFWRQEGQAQRTQLLEELDVASRAEFGLTMTEIVDFLGEALRWALGHQSAVVVIERDEFLHTMSGRLNWEPTKAAHALQLFSLEPRPAFLRPPQPFNVYDVYPWRFNRRLSYIRRPFISRVDDGRNLVLWGARQVHQCSRYLFELCLEGRLQAESLPMKHFQSRMLNQQGEQFNDEVADFLESQTAFRVRRRIDKFGPLRGASGPPGDIDVLALDVNRKVLRAIEAKDFSMAKTPWEINQEIEKLLPAGGGDSAIEKHLKRVTWLREHLAVVLESLGVPNSRGWQVSGEIVIRQELVTPYLREQSDLPIVTFRDFQEKYRGK